MSAWTWMLLLGVSGLWLAMLAAVAYMTSLSAAREPAAETTRS
ncbi:MAG TPA: hypothetical protein VFJ77_10400 [Gaiellaceae bacterium]|nr:hypothetical protein [Gaiellaceae bacterium]